MPTAKKFTVLNIRNDDLGLGDSAREKLDSLLLSITTCSKLIGFTKDFGVSFGVTTFELILLAATLIKSSPPI